MNLLYYDTKYDYKTLYEVCKVLKEELNAEVIAIPKDCQFIVDASAEDLFGLADKIMAALQIIKEERPEEFRQAMRMRQYERFREVVLEKKI